MPSKASSRKPRPDSHEWSFAAIGTSWWIGIYEPIDTGGLQDLQRKIAVRIEQFDAAYSRFRADSLVSALARAAGSYEFPDDGVALFTLYRDLYDATDGAVTPLIGQVLADAGYDAAYTLHAKRLQTPPGWDDVLSIEGSTVTARRPVLLDFGAAGKGYLVDIISALLRENSVKRFFVDAGGDMYCEGLEEPLQIGLENPDDTSQVIGVTALRRGALCGSAGNRRAWGQYHHIMDPAKLASPRHIKAVWAQAETALLADALTTALYFAPPDRLRESFTFEYLILYADNTMARSDGFVGELYI